MNRGRSGDGRGTLGHPTGAKGELSREGGVMNMGKDAGGRGVAPNTSQGFGPGSVGGAKRVPRRGGEAPMPAGTSRQSR